MFTSFLKLAGASLSLLFWCFWTPFCVRKAAYKATRVHTPLFLSRPLSTPARGTGVLCEAFVHLLPGCLFCLSGASGPQPPPLFVKPYTPPPPSKPTTMCALLLRARVCVRGVPKASSAPPPFHSPFGLPPPPVYPLAAPFCLPFTRKAKSRAEAPFCHAFLTWLGHTARALLAEAKKT